MKAVNSGSECSVQFLRMGGLLPARLKILEHETMSWELNISLVTLVQDGHKPEKHGKPGKVRELKLSKSQEKLRKI